METKVCSKCNIKKDVTEFEVNRRQCKSCRYEQIKRYRENKPVKEKLKLKEYQKEYRKNNREKLLLEKKKYYEKNKERFKERNKEYQKEYRKNNRERLLLEKKKYYEKNKEWILKRQSKKYYEDNKEKILERQKKLKGPRVCKKCNIEKDITEFPKQKRTCKLCNLEYNRKWRKENWEWVKERDSKYKKEYYKKNKEIIKEKRKEYYDKNKERINDLEKRRKYLKKYREDNKEKIKKYREDNKEKRKEYYEDNKEKIIKRNREYYRKRRETDALFRLKDTIRTSIRTSIKLKGYKKKSKTHIILGCSFKDFKTHIENLFEDWMSWDNYGNPKDGVLELNKTWDLDHIVPLSSAECEEDIIRLNHYSNIQPLCSYINRNVKRGNIDWES